MSPSKFRLEISYDEWTGEPVAAYVRIREGPVARTDEWNEGVVFADYSADGSLLGIELLAPCSGNLLENIAETESEPVRQFLRRGIRKEMIVS